MSVTLFEAHFNSIIGLPVGEVAQESLNQNLTPGSDEDYLKENFKRKLRMKRLNRSLS